MYPYQNKNTFCIISSIPLCVCEGQLLENFVISELEKRRKLGFIKAEQFYYYKTVAGREIDLVFEADNTLHAVEIKATRAPSSKDIANLREFVQQTGKHARGYLFHLGEEYAEADGIQIMPVHSLFRGK
ncbi:MAG: hypothetical protein CVV42_16940 [Candidatus Riflebacteria bacterium HGW-Riflebacteria-2]|nr:MAG: hypothetical protein CVV42_16940 [Candidatus Riflebacteria bacterium HGW-Riflebacteria-2]